MSAEKNLRMKICIFFISMMLGLSLYAQTCPIDNFENVVTFCTEDNDLGISYPAGSKGVNVNFFYNTTDSVNEVACLESILSASWFAMQIGESGELGITIEHSEGEDVDFACFGPFYGETKVDMLRSVCANAKDAFSIDYRAKEKKYIPVGCNYSQDYIRERDSITNALSKISTDCITAASALYPFGSKEYMDYVDRCSDVSVKLPADPAFYDYSLSCFRAKNDEYPAQSIVDCSYSGSYKELCYLPNCKKGEWYLLLIPNFSGMPGTISFNKSFGDASTSCTVIVDASSDEPYYCEGETIRLTVSNAPSDATFSWTGPNGFFSTSKSPSIPNATTDNAGIYTVQMTANGHLSPIVNLNVVVNEKKLTSIEDTIKQGERYYFGSRRLTETGVYEESLLTSVGCDSLVSLNLYVEPNNVDSFAPIYEDSLTIDTAEVDSAPFYPSLIVTPNGDGYNDRWIIEQIEEYHAKVKIYDRYGRVIAKYDDYQNETGWDGTDLNGNPLPSSDYWYEIDVESLDEIYVGHFTLLR